MSEPSIPVIRSHNRKAVNEFFDALIPRELHKLRCDLSAQSMDAFSRTDQVNGLGQVLERDREQKLVSADDLAQRGYRITRLYSDPHVVLRTERVRSIETSIKHDVSEPRGGVSSEEKYA